MVALVMHLLASAPTSLADPGPALIECPDSNVHVWDKDQCKRIVTDPFGGFGGGGSGGCRGLLCHIPGLGGLLGGIL